MIPIRKPDANEQRAFERARGQRERMRRAVERAIAAGSAMGYLEQWIRSRGLEGLPPALTAGQAARLSNLAQRATLAEDALAGLETASYTATLTADGGDLDVWDLAPGETWGHGLGAFFIPLIVVGIVLVCSALAAYIASIVAESTEIEAQLRRQKMDLDAAMARAPADVRAAYGKFQESNPYAQEKSLWDKLTEGVSGALGIGALVLLGLFAFSAFRKSSPAPAPAGAPPTPNPRRRRRARSNPCGTGGGRTPDEWRVDWSRDPGKRGRQMGYVIDSARKDLSGWSDYWGPAEGWPEEEVPF